MVQCERKGELEKINRDRGTLFRTAKRKFDPEIAG